MKSAMNRVGCFVDISLWLKPQAKYNQDSKAVLIMTGSKN
ncbi:MAG: hypothetical protein ACI9ES_000571 [Oceanospirillaceae bacterium]|jgi:hypothetical protein